MMSLNKNKNALAVIRDTVNGTIHMNEKFALCLNRTSLHIFISFISDYHSNDNSIVFIRLMDDRDLVYSSEVKIHDFDSEDVIQTKTIKMIKEIFERKEYYMDQLLERLGFLDDLLEEMRGECE